MKQMGKDYACEVLGFYYIKLRMIRRNGELSESVSNALIDFTEYLGTLVTLALRRKLTMNIMGQYILISNQRISLLI